MTSNWSGTWLKLLHAFSEQRNELKKDGSQGNWWERWISSNLHCLTVHFFSILDYVFHHSPVFWTFHLESIHSAIVAKASISIIWQLLIHMTVLEFHSESLIWLRRDRSAWRWVSSSARGGRAVWLETTTITTTTETPCLQPKYGHSKLVSGIWRKTQIQHLTEVKYFYQQHDGNGQKN